MKLCLSFVFLFIMLLAPVPLTKSQIKPLKSISSKELECLVKNAFHEAIGEGDTGMLIVTKVVLNRSAITGESYCKTIHRNHQFSWTTKKHKHIPSHVYSEISAVILQFYNGFITIPEEFHDVLFFHNTSVKPYWTKGLVKIGNWRNHVFYKSI